MYALIANSDAVRRADGAIIPASTGNADWRAYQVWLVAGGVPTPVPAPVTTTAHVKGEAQRRIVVLVGATDLTSCLIKQLNANMRANELNDIRHERPLTPQEEVEAAALRGLAAQIKHIRDRSNVIEAMQPIPSDYTADSYWD